MYLDLKTVFDCLCPLEFHDLCILFVIDCYIVSSRQSRPQRAATFGHVLYCFITFDYILCDLNILIVSTKRMRNSTLVAVAVISEDEVDGLQLSTSEPRETEYHGWKKLAGNRQQLRCVGKWQIGKQGLRPRSLAC